MLSSKPWYALLAFGCICVEMAALAEAAAPGNTSGQSESSGAASEAEVAKLRQEVVELRALLQQLLQAQGKPESPALTQPDSGSATRAEVDELKKQVADLRKKASETPAATAGWNGEHFFLRSTDGNFVIMPVGYLDGQYNVYGNSYGTPPDSFAITRARFGFQGNYGKQLDYVMQIETISSPTVRDAYLLFKPWSFLNITAGQFKVPYSMEVGTADTAVEFYNRSIMSVLYPDAGGAFRSPGLDVHGELAGGSTEYWLGIFNGQGLLASGTTNEAEVVGRLRFSPFKHSDISFLKGLSFGGSYEHSRSKGLSSELSFSGVMNDGAYTFFPQFKINGNVNRYNGFASWLDGPLSIRGEYAHLQQDRSDIGTLTLGGIGNLSQPPVRGEGYYVSASYFLTGESNPQNALPRVRHPVIGPASPGESGAPGWGAWALKFRYSKLQGDAPGFACDATTLPACPITPVIAPAYIDHTEQFTFGVNWYLNYWVLVKSEVNLDRLRTPSVQGIAPRNYYVFLETLQFRF